MQITFKIKENQTLNFNKIPFKKKEDENITW